MARSRSRFPLNVFLNGKLLGKLKRQTSGGIEFQYEESWLKWEHALPISLSLPLREDRYIGDSVSTVFDNLLPDHVDVRRHLAERVGSEGGDTFSLLAAVGRDCVGALQFLPEEELPGPAGEVSGRTISEKEIANLLSDLHRIPLGVSKESEIRISLAGTQDKMALLFWRGRWRVPKGSTATTHILKPQIGKLANGLDLSQSVENEHFCMRIMEAFGLPTAKTQIEIFEGKNVLVVERFDRRWTQDKRLLRLPQEDCCQILSFPPTRKYESDGGPGMVALLELLKGSDEAEIDRRLFMKAQMVFWLLAATDGHAKNFSIHLYPGGRFRLAPFYDVLSVQPNLDIGKLQKEKAKMAMAIGKRRHDIVDSILPRHFVQTGELADMPGKKVRDLMEEVREEASKAIETACNDLPPTFPGKLTELVIKGFRKRLRSFHE